MTASRFKVHNQEFLVDSNEDISSGLVIKSSPRPYKVTFASIKDVLGNRPASSFQLFW